MWRLLINDAKFVKRFVLPANLFAQLQIVTMIYVVQYMHTHTYIYLSNIYTYIYLYTNIFIYIWTKAAADYLVSFLSPSLSFLWASWNDLLPAIKCSQCSLTLALSLSLSFIIRHYQNFISLFIFFFHFHFHLHIFCLFRLIEPAYQWSSLISAPCSSTVKARCDEQWWNRNHTHQLLLYLWVILFLECWDIYRNMSWARACSTD